MIEGFDVRELSGFARNHLEGTARRYPKKIQKFLRKEGKKLKRKVLKKVKSTVGKKTGNYLQGWNRGKVYRYHEDEDAVRVYNTSPHAHLIELGHRMVTKDGEEVGFVKGKQILPEVESSFQGEFVKDAETFVDELLKEGV
ncbi:HK97 gp10 family phage protein [Filifactor alocis]|uniref:HK97 gp10 family phage protein n=1 Tax=Filifactor alocis TaxID=143361 RepID=UPI003FA0A088